MSHRRRALLHLLAGAWLAVIVGTSAMAIMSFATAPTRAEVAAGGVAKRAARVHAMSFNGPMFQGSAAAQLVLAGLAVLIVAWPPRAPRLTFACVAAAALATALSSLAITPRSNAIARTRVAALQRGDVSARPPDEEARFKRLHRAYGALDVLKAGLLIGASAAALGSARREE